MPLKAIIQQQQSILSSLGYTCMTLNNTQDVASFMAGPNYPQYIFTHPEVLASNLVPALAASSNNTLLPRIKYIVIDESHLVLSWGESHKKSTAFRADYSNIAAARAVLTETAIAALTATATKKLADEIADKLQLDDPVRVAVSPEKLNIRYSLVKTIGDTAQEHFNWLADYLMVEGVNCQKMIIFCHKQSYLSAIYVHLLHRHPGKVRAYHKDIPSHQQTELRTKFCDPESELRVLVCSSSFAMGVDIPGLYLIIHYGMPPSLEEYLQETGRAGRDGGQSWAVVLHHGNANKGSVVSDACKEYAKLKTCRRAYLLKAFGHAVTLEDREKCCDICSSTLRSLPEVLIQEEEHEPINIIVRQALDDAQEEDLTQQLNRLNGDRTGMYLVPKLMYPQLVKKIIKHHQNISGVQDVMRLGCYSTHMAESVIAVLDEMVPLI